MKLLKIYFDKLTSNSDSRILKGYINICKLNYEEISTPEKWLKDRLMLISLSILYPAMIRLSSLQINKSVLIEPSNVKKNVEIYQYYLNKNIEEKFSYFHWKKGIRIKNYVDFLLFLKSWGKLVYLSIFSFLMFCKLPFYEIFKLQIFLLFIAINKPQKIYIFDYSNVVSYLLTIILSKNINIFYIPTNSNLSTYLKYSYLSNISIVLSSKLQIQEYYYLINKGWLIAKNVSIMKWENLFSIYFDIQKKEKLYDIGFYSSGEWARSMGIFREKNIDKIKENVNTDNELSKLSLMIISFLVKFVIRNNLTLGIYLHPYERDLISRYGLYPPFIGQVDSKNVFLSDCSNEMNSNIFEAELGIITISSILYDRNSYNLNSLFYSNEQFHKKYKHIIYDERVYSCKNSQSFNNIIELENKLNNYFIYKKLI
ncbi:MAG: hypothetical protein KJ571_18575 [Bacteroidetes bacterium]|nr:hypothetical protein [Bacteroidota bacterium]